MVDINIYRNRIGCFIRIYAGNSPFKGESSIFSDHVVYFKGKSSISRKSNFSMICMTVFAIMIFNSQIECNFSQVKSKTNNKNCHILNGNLANINSFKMVHINKGNSNFENKYDDLAQILDHFKPHILSIQEANYNIESNIGFRGYKIEYNQLNKSHKMARTVVLIKEDIPYERCKNFENEYVSSVWVQIFLSKSKSFYVLSAYRQWSLPSSMGILNSNSKNSQIYRYNILCNQVSKVSKCGKDIVIMTDDNINTLEDKCNSNLYKNYELKQIRDNMIIDNRLTTHNDSPTFFRPGIISCIDHVMTNCPDKITDVTTHNDYDNNSLTNDSDHYENENRYGKKTNLCISDHSIISFSYNSKYFKIPQLFKILRDNSKITCQKLTELFNKNLILPTILQSNDPNFIAETIVNELSIMVEILAPSKLIQCSKKFAPWLNNEFFFKILTLETNYTLLLIKLIIL